MAVFMGHPQGALARASLEIRERLAARRDDRRLARRALHRADELLGEIEELQLAGFADVPSWCKENASEVGWAAIDAGIPHPRLETDAGVIKLMDDVYQLEERLMRRLRTRIHRVTAA
jgi:hypothetical protein